MRPINMLPKLPIPPRRLITQRTIHIPLMRRLHNIPLSRRDLRMTITSMMAKLGPAPTLEVAPRALLLLSPVLASGDGSLATGGGFGGRGSYWHDDGLAVALFDLDGAAEVVGVVREGDFHGGDLGWGVGVAYEGVGGMADSTSSVFGLADHEWVVVFVSDNHGIPMLIDD